MSQSAWSQTAPRRSPWRSGPKGVWLWAFEAQLARRAARLREAVEAAGAVYVPEHLHHVRIAVKKLRYSVELADETTGKRIAADVAALKAAQDLLGQLHDLEVLLARRGRHRHRWRGPISPRGATSGRWFTWSKTTAGGYTRATCAIAPA